MSKRFIDCKYSCFISFCADDQKFAEPDWVTKFETALFEKLSTRIGRSCKEFVIKRQPFFQPLNGPKAGVLADKLKVALSESYWLVIVAGKNYSDSDWCLDEIKWFWQQRGDAEAKRSVVIVAMTDEARTGLLSKDRRLQGLTWHPFHYKSQIDKPIYSTEKDFNDEVIKLADEMLSPIKDELNESNNKAEGSAKHQPAKLESTNGDGNENLLPIAYKTPIPRIVVAPPHGAITEMVSDWVRSLKERSAGLFEVESWTENDLTDKKTPLRERMKGALHLVVPIGDPELLMGYVSGGHLKILDDEWTREHRIAPIFLRFFSGKVDAFLHGVEESHVPFIDPYVKAAREPHSVLDELCPPRPSNVSGRGARLIIDTPSPQASSINEWMRKNQREMDVTPHFKDLRYAGSESPGYSPEWAEAERKDLVELLKASRGLLVMISKPEAPATTAKLIEKLEKQLQSDDVLGASWPRFFQIGIVVLNPPVAVDNYPKACAGRVLFWFKGDDPIRPLDEVNERNFVRFLKDVAGTAGVH